MSVFKDQEKFMVACDQSVDKFNNDQFTMYVKLIAEESQELIDAIKIKPYTGIGKPEPLKYQFKGYWSRRINKEHRLVYKVTQEDIIVVACMYHY